MSAYKIAEYLPEEARLAAARQLYVPSEGRRLTVTGCCPLGVVAERWPAFATALAANLRHSIYGVNRPAGDDVYSALRTIHHSEGSTDPGEDEDGVLLDACHRFIWAWDTGKITDLADALGVQP